MIASKQILKSVNPNIRGRDLYRYRVGKQLAGEISGQATARIVMQIPPAECWDLHSRLPGYRHFSRIKSHSLLPPTIGVWLRCGVSPGGSAVRDGWLMRYSRVWNGNQKSTGLLVSWSKRSHFLFTAEAIVSARCSSPEPNRLDPPLCCCFTHSSGQRIILARSKTLVVPASKLSAAPSMQRIARSLLVAR